MIEKPLHKALATMIEDENLKKDGGPFEKVEDNGLLDSNGNGFESDEKSKNEGPKSPNSNKNETNDKVTVNGDTEKSDDKSEPMEQEDDRRA